MSLKANVSAATTGTGDFIGDFKHFLQQSSIIETAVGLIIGNAFKDIVDKFVTEIMTPLISHLIGGTDSKLEDMKLMLGGNGGADDNPQNVIHYGRFLKGVLNFVLQSILVFAIVRFWVYLRKLPRLAPF